MIITARAVRRLTLIVVLLASYALATAARADSDPGADRSPIQIDARPDIVQLAQAEGCPTSGKTVVVFYRYVGPAEAKAIQRTSAIPMTNAAGDSKVVYFTDCFYSSAGDAKEYLALPAKPEYRVEFILRGVRARCMRGVAPAFGEPGGGNECTLNRDSAPISIPDPAEAIEPLQ